MCGLNIENTFFFSHGQLYVAHSETACCAYKFDKNCNKYRKKSELYEIIFEICLKHTKTTPLLINSRRFLKIKYLLPIFTIDTSVNLQVISEIYM